MSVKYEATKDPDILKKTDYIEESIDLKVMRAKIVDLKALLVKYDAAPDTVTVPNDEKFHAIERAQEEVDKLENEYKAWL